MQLRHYVELQEELAINYCKLAVVSVDSPVVNDAFRTGLRASFPFLSDHERTVVKMLDMTETSKSRGVTAMPYTFPCCRTSKSTIFIAAIGIWAVRRSMSLEWTCAPCCALSGPTSKDRSVDRPVRLWPRVASATLNR